jgi:putative flippase GtrA
MALLRAVPFRSIAAMTTFALYVLFAAVSMLANLVAQEAVVRTAPIAALPLSILAGTAAGFAVKYLLDKKWIFEDAYAGARSEIRKVSLYGFFSVFTTLIFWAFEVAFLKIWGTDFAKYTGAVLGLSIGYAIKYLLDRTFVFRERPA